MTEATRNAGVPSPAEMLTFFHPSTKVHIFDCPACWGFVLDAAKFNRPALRRVLRLPLGITPRKEANQ